MSQSHYHTPLDREWVELMKMARDAGITKEEVQDFLQKQGVSRKTSTVR
ncbi:anti-repressor SinI family protein [Salibacterium qingdaonense]|uniref:Anti-repressor SinI n=1 Tax=Salibacterium qingdaonense TaxID=266892 RepID=A0A1I4K401_9BACI|nr:anti-repressor SinI family protein [Salibacterium qingdaonense]SFL73196.1 Anti-repressor SinI [Salibacterium qingdaonense]